MSKLDIFMIVVIAIVVIAGIILSHREAKQERKEKAERRAKLLKQFEDEKAKPRSVVSFVHVEGHISSSEPCEPYLASYIGKVITSAERANSHMNHCYMRGYFQAADGTTLPVRMVRAAYVNEETT